MSFFSSFKIFTGILFGRDDLCESREDIISDISFLSVKSRKRYLWLNKIDSLGNVLVKI